MFGAWGDSGRGGPAVRQPVTPEGPIVEERKRRRRETVERDSDIHSEIERDRESGGERQ